MRGKLEKSTVPALPSCWERPCKNTPGVGSPPRPRIGDPHRENLHVARPWDPLDRRHTKLSGWRRSTRRLLGDRRLSVFATRPGVFCDLGRLKLTSECVFLLRAGHLPHHGDDQNAADRWVDPRVQRSCTAAPLCAPPPHERWSGREGAGDQRLPRVQTICGDHLRRKAPPVALLGRVGRAWSPCLRYAGVFVTKPEPLHAEEKSQSPS